MSRTYLGIRLAFAGAGVVTVAAGLLGTVATNPFATSSDYWFTLALLLVSSGPFILHVVLIQTRRVSVGGGLALLIATVMAYVDVIFLTEHSTRGIGFVTSPVFNYLLFLAAYLLDKRFLHEEARP